MIQSVMKKVGCKAEIFSKTFSPLGYTFGRIKFIKSTSEHGTDSVTDAGVINSGVYVFVGSGDGDGKNITEDAIIKYNGETYIVLRCDFSRLNQINIVWAALKKIKSEEEK